MLDAALVGCWINTTRGDMSSSSGYFTARKRTIMKAIALPGRSRRTREREEEACNILGSPGLGREYPPVPNSRQTTISLQYDYIFLHQRQLKWQNKCECLDQVWPLRCLRCSAPVGYWHVTCRCGFSRCDALRHARELQPHARAPAHQSRRLQPFPSRPPLRRRATPCKMQSQYRAYAQPQVPQRSPHATNQRRGGIGTKQLPPSSHQTVPPDPVR